MFIDFIERGRESERKKHWCEREILVGYFPYRPWLGIEPTTFGYMGWCYNQLSNLARAKYLF